MHICVVLCMHIAHFIIHVTGKDDIIAHPEEKRHKSKMIDFGFFLYIIIK